MVLGVAVAVVAIIQVVCVLALVDQYRGLIQIREGMGLIDTPQPIELAAMAESPSPSAIGLPGHLDAAERVVVAFLSTKCMTCRTIGRGLHGRVPRDLWVVVEGPTEEECARWLDDVGLARERVMVENMNDGVASRLDLSVFPSTLVFDQGSLTAAETLPSSRQLSRLLSAPVAPPLAATSVREKEPRHAH